MLEDFDSDYDLEDMVRDLVVSTYVALANFVCRLEYAWRFR